MLRCLLIAGMLACACKGKGASKAQSGSAAGSGSSEYVAPVRPSGASAAAASKRRALFEKIKQALTDAGGDCDKLGAAIGALTEEAQAARDLKYELLDADRTSDAKLEADTLPYLRGRTSQCRERSPELVEFLRTLVGVQPDGSASGSQR